MKQVVVVFAVFLVLPGCAQLSSKLRRLPVTEVNSAPGQLRPVARPAPLNTGAAAVSDNARTVEDFDTTTNEQRAAAGAETVVRETNLGLTVASLGSAGEPGFWLKTPLVSKAARGRVEYVQNGASVLVDLIPIDGPKTAGSRMSLAALRLIEAPLTGLTELRVYQLSE